MEVRKVKADKIFTGREMVDDKVLIFSTAGEIIDLVDEGLAGDGVEKLNGILSPGFVNCHCHLELSQMHGLIPRNTGLVDFVFSVVTQRNHQEKEILQAIAQADTAMKKDGIVAVGDICNNLLTLPQKEQSQMRYYNFVETSGWLPGLAEERFNKGFELYKAFSKEMRASLVPHAPYSVSESLWRFLKPGFKNKVVTIHSQETAYENEFFTSYTGDLLRMYEKMKMDTSFFKPSGKSSLQSIFEQLKDAEHIILVHNTFASQADLDFVKQQRPGDTVSFCLCVRANQYIEQALPPVQLFLNNNCHIVLGTDSLASNDSLSIWDEITNILECYDKLALAEVLRWATLNGAEALGMQESLGSFDVGKQPGIVWLARPTTSLQSVEPVRLA